jgi:hypothetical protein
MGEAQMEKELLARLDRMRTKHELHLAKMGARRGVVPDELIAQIERLEGGLYALREGVHGIMKAKEIGFSLATFDSYLNSMQLLVDQIENEMSDTIAKVQAFFERSRPK